MDASISLDSIVVAISDQVSCDFEGETAILNLKSGVYYGLNPVGATVWKLIANPTAVSALRDELLEQYEVEPGQCLDDLLALLGELRQQGLIEVTGLIGEK